MNYHIEEHDADVTIHDLLKLISVQRDGEGKWVIMNVWADIMGNTRNIFGNVVGNVVGNVCGSVEGDVLFHVWGNVGKDVKGKVYGEVLQQEKCVVEEE